MRNASKWARKAAAMAVSAFALAALAGAPGRATDIDFHSLDQQYLHRNAGTNLEDNLKALEKLDEAQSGADGEVLWRLCRVKVRHGETREKKADKLAEYESAKKNCEKAISFSSQTANAHFWYGVALGRWGETKGLMKALFIIKPLRKEMAEVLRLDPSHGGAHNVLGEILWQVPGFAGGSKKKALEEFETAVKLSPDYTANYKPLAEAYLHFGRKDDAIRVLKRVEAIANPADPAEYPDNLADAKKLLAELEPVQK